MKRFTTVDAEELDALVVRVDDLDGRVQALEGGQTEPDPPPPDPVPDPEPDPDPVPEPPPPLPPPPTGSSYFDALVARPDTLLAAPLDSQVDISRYVAGDPTVNWLFSEPSMSAEGRVHVSVDRDADIRPQLHFPIHQTDGTLVVVWEMWHGAEWQRGGLPAKTWMIRNITGGIKWELRVAWGYLGRSSRTPGDPATDLGLIDMRSYHGTLGPNTYRARVNADDPTIEGRTSDSVQPMLADVYVPIARWQRYVMKLTLQPGGFDLCSVWVIPEGGAPVQIFDEWEGNYSGGAGFFAFHYDSSAQVKDGGPYAAFGRHVWIGHSAADIDVTPLLVAPVAEATALAVDTDL